MPGYFENNQEKFPFLFSIPFSVVLFVSKNVASITKDMEILNIRFPALLLLIKRDSYSKMSSNFVVNMISSINSFSPIMTRAISCRVLIFLSTTTFCCGVNGAEYS